MTITIKTKNVGDVKDVYCYGEYKKTLEDMNEDYIKKELKISSEVVDENIR